MHASNPCDDVTEIPLTAAQQLIWVRQRLAPDAPLYDAPCTFRIEGELDETAFVDAFDRLVAVSDALRYVVREHEGEPRAVIRATGARGCELVDLTDRPEGLEAWVETRMHRALDPAECLYDAALLRLAPNCYCWYLSTHHLVTDGWNLMLLFRRMEATYRAVLDGDTTAPAPSFADYAAEEHDYAASEDRLRHARWWSERDAQAHRGSRFYAARVGNPHLRHTRVAVPLGAERSDRLRALAGEPGFQALTPDMAMFNVVATAVIAWYWRLEATSEVCLGVTSHGRTRPRYRDTAGLFMQQLPFRVDISDDDTFRALARTVARAAMSFLEHAVPGAASPRAQKCFDVTLNYIPGSFGEFAGLPTEMRWRHNGYGDPERRLGITVHDFNGTGGLELLFDFNDAAFTEAARAATVRHLLATFDAMAGAPDAALARFALLGEAEWRACLAHLDGGARAGSPDANLWERFDCVARDAASRPALEGAGVSMSFAELRDAATELAEALSRAGIVPGDLVAVESGRRAETIPLLLGILAAGCAFLPIEPDLPEARRQWLAQDSRAAAVVRTGPGGRAEINPAPAGASLRPPAGTAYVLYTSGSTGEPNGVAVGHASVVNLMEAFERLAPLETGCRCAWWTNIGFDVAIYEIFSALLYGRALAVPDESVRLDPPALFAWLHETGIAGAYLPPFFVAAFDDWLDGARTSALRRLLVGVEAIPQQRLASIMRKVPPLRIVNGYGPTEATVCATLHVVDPDDEDTGPAPIGLPVPGSRACLLDPHGNVVPRGAVGELFVAGASLSLGYLHRNELNAERFVTDPLGASGERFFRTRDGVRLREDGVLEFVGRLDNQIKLHGVRIEPGEIVQVLLEHPQISESVVTVTGNQGDERGRRLVAYYVASGSVDEAALRTYARARLPSPLVPASFVALPAIPRNINGKPDLDRLPAAPPPEPAGDERVFPRNEPERLIADIWSDVLGLQSVGVREDFIDLGGDSLRAATVVARVNDAFSIELPISKAFESATVEKLAILVETTLIEEIAAMTEDEAALQSQSRRDR